MTEKRISEVEGAIKKWLENVVIGLNLCPFAKGPYIKGEVKLTVSQSTTVEDLYQDFGQALQNLAAQDEVETTLLIVPEMLQEFEDYLDFLGMLEDALERGKLDEQFQIASFHPRYRFEGTEEGDRTNYTNRAPFPIFHLLRQGSVTNAVEEFPDTADIPERNMELLENMEDADFERIFGA